MNKTICFVLAVVCVLFMAFVGHAAEDAKTPASLKGKEERSEPLAISLLQAVKKKYVSFSAHGNSINSSYISIKNLTDKTLRLTITPGTFLSSGSVQNMVLTNPQDVVLSAKEQYSRSVSTACMNIHRAIPGGGNAFGIAQRPDSHLLAKAIKLLNKGNYPYPVIQAAVWIVTDNADYNDMGTLQSQFGRVISHDDYQKALSIVKEARKMK